LSTSFEWARGQSTSLALGPAALLETLDHLRDLFVEGTGGGPMMLARVVMTWSCEDLPGFGVGVYRISTLACEHSSPSHPNISPQIQQSL
jgi:hypothetical protein